MKISAFLALLFVGSFLLCSFVQLGIAQTRTLGGTVNLQVQPKFDGKVFFTNEKVHTSPSSIRLFIPKNATLGSYAMALYPINGTLSSVKSFSIMTSYVHALPRFMLCLQKGNHSWPDTFLLSDYQSVSNGEWTGTVGGNKWGWTETNIDLTNYGSFWNTLDYWVAKYGNLRIWYIGILLEYWAVDPDGFGEPLYADELTLNGITYTIAPYAGSAPSPASNGSSYKISGHILDSSRKGIGGANIIFNVPDLVPSVWSDSSGYYAIYAPAGKYHIRVWPPFDSHFINYDEEGFIATSDATKNITLDSGYKVSGYITNTLGEPVKDGIVSLNNYLSGWLSKDSGYYFVCVPAGTYKLTANPRSGYHHFNNYYESNFVVNSDIVKNITVTMADNPSPNPTPEPTPTPIPDQAWISISLDTKSSSVGSTINVRGRLTDYEGHPIPNQSIRLAYAETSNLQSWITIGSTLTAPTGEYDIPWVIAFSGNFLLKVEWIIDNFPRAFNTTSVGFTPNEGIDSLKLESDSTLSEQTYVTEKDRAGGDIGIWVWIAVSAVIITAVAIIVGMRVVKSKKVAGQQG